MNEGKEKGRKKERKDKNRKKCGIEGMKQKGRKKGGK